MTQTRPSQEDMPSKDINPGNAIQRIEECKKYMSLQQWSKFFFLYPLLMKFQDIRIKGAGKILSDDDKFTCAFNKLRAITVNSLLKNLDSAQSFDEFLNWIDRLSEIVTDQRCLWNILHTEVQPSLKVTLEQSRQIASKFFSPDILFSFGFDSFLQSGLTDFSIVKNESDLIDIFYATAGFMRACNLDPKYILEGEIADKLKKIVQKILSLFISFPEFDAHRFVWLVEAINDNLHMKEKDLRSICENVLNDFSKQMDSDESSLTKLQKMCVLSTSPFLQTMPAMNDLVTKTFQNTALSKRKFVHRYIFGSYVHFVWLGEALPRVSDPLVEWRLYISNLAGRINESHELPALLLADVINDSLSYFIGYYGEVQPSKERSVNLRMDIFTIVDTCAQYYPNDGSKASFTQETLKQIWYLLYIVAFSGAKDEELENVKYDKPSEDNTPYLGLKHNNTDFENYREAIGILGKKFESENEIFPQMIEFIRQNYNNNNNNNPSDQKK
ncbi:hypothetical protein M9Y10_039615 [Tritrichomonas musculus]|uniref:Uncharacterized protein n=1 Tax=Tritrichomonas musculus TaxID=1915356 RepID=A0ABR2KBP0_9EUKA